MTDDQLLTRPIVILGAPRSGTTVLSQLLKFHPQVYLADEPRILWKYGNDGKSDALQPDDARPEVVSHIRREFASKVRDAGRERLVEKTPSNSLRVGFVDRVLPDAIFIHIMREGTESVLSIRKFWDQHATGVGGTTRRQLLRRLKEIKLRQAPYYAGEFARRVMTKVLPSKKPRGVWGPRVPGIQEMVRDLDPLEVAAWQWRMCVEHVCRIGRTLPADRYTECRLEEFGKEEFQQLLAFCQLEWTPEVEAGFAQKYENRPTKARSAAADTAEVELVEQLIAPTATWLETLEPLARHRTGK
ncbi:sulfotransferase [Aeoliella sp. ICT_H6.2]|uniref:Sulfotransferase n=1 Tax=Aeoliella straminimaris TaxID=2954799 RepID=A0A9X2F954_9BACT|nr:sulfotransferase [Aeoliella straminimaris]MCO6044154.1 sulfotransferase [Aeoliella straminimaris]